MALLFAEPFASHFLNRSNIRMLKKFDCDLRLYNKLLSVSLLPLKVECSTKIYNDDDKEETGRYTVTLLLREWNGFKKPAQNEVLSILGFTRQQLNEILQKHSLNITRDTDIIFGFAGDIGKIYLDFDNGLVCYESTGKVKHYDLTDNGFKINAEAKCEHIRVKHYETFRGYPVYWIAQSQSFKTYYVRPSYATFLTNMVDVLSMIC
jgi:hypothetical protein